MLIEKIVKKYFYFLILSFLFFPFTSYSTEANTPLNVVEQVEKNLIYSKEIIKEDDANNILIQRGGWDQNDTQELESATAQKKKKTKIKVTEVKEDKRLIALKRKAFNAMNLGQYEVAVYLYKQVLKQDENDTYAMLGLATAYQYLGQYIQAKPLYMKVLEIFPQDQQVMVNLLSIIINETPYESVYLLSSMADKNMDSPLIQAQASIAYTKVKNYQRAIDYIKRAIELDQNNLEYKYNLAVLYDLNNNYDQAKFLYNELLSFYATNPETTYNLPLKEIQDRLNALKNVGNNKK